MVIKIKWLFNVFLEGASMEVIRGNLLLYSFHDCKCILRKRLRKYKDGLEIFVVFRKRNGLTLYRMASSKNVFYEA